MEINERRILKLRMVKFEISPKTLMENGQDVTIIVKAQIIDVHEPINQDGTKDLEFIAKALTAELK